MCACATVSELAISNYEDYELVTHCFAFMEMLDVNTMFLRAYLKCLRWTKDLSGSISMEEELISTPLLERVILDKIQTDQLLTRDLDAVRMVLQMKKEKLPTSFLVKIAETKGWFQMIAFGMYFNYNLEQVFEVCDRAFHGSIVSTNIKRAIRWEILPERSKRRNSSTYRDKRKSLNKNEVMVTSGDTMSSSISSTETIEKLKQSSSKFISEDADLFATIIQSVVDVNNVMAIDILLFEKFNEILKKPNQIQPTTHLNLLRKSLRLRRPVLAVLAGISSELNVQYCWVTWMIASMESYAFPNEPFDCQVLSKSLIEFSVAKGFIRTLHQGMNIFFPDNNFNIFLEYLVRTNSLDFSTETTELLKKYFVALSDDDVELLCLNNDSTAIFNFSIVLLVQHLQFGFESKEYQRLMLTSLCQSEIDFNNIIDFCMINAINEILTFTCVEIDITLFMKDRCTEEKLKQEHERICDELWLNKEFTKAMKAADLFSLPKDNIIYSSWMSAYECDFNFDTDRYDMESDQYSLSPEVVIKFYVRLAVKEHENNPKKYKILKKILDVIKKHHLFPTECVDRDSVEYEMAISFLKSSLDIHDIELYYSEYFETIMSNERFVLYKSFLDLKEMAGIEELKVSNKVPLTDSELEKLNSLINRLLDDGDIIQALRLQVCLLTLILRGYQSL